MATDRWGGPSGRAQARAGPGHVSESGIGVRSPAMRRRLGIAIVAAVVLLGCSSGDDESGDGDGGGTDESGTTATTEAAVPEAEAVVGAIESRLGPASFAVTAHPLVRADDALVLTLDVQVDGAEGAIGRDPAGKLRSIWGSSSFLDLQDWVGLRLLDTEGDLVVPPAVDAAGDTVAVVTETDDDGSAFRLQVAYGDPGADELALFVPQAGVLTGLPIIEGDVPEPGDGAGGAADAADADEIELAAVASAPIEPMVAYALDLAGADRIEAQAEEVTIALGADVLFAVDAADLTPAAQAVIDEAVVALQARAPGTVLVTGHTDSTASDAYNLDLSQRRADAVAAALAQRIDTAAYPIQAEGRGEGEPVDDNGTEEGRAANRRVELTIATELLDDAPEASTAAPIAFEGPTATGAEGVAVDIGRPWRVAAPRATVVDGHLVVELTTTATDTEEGSVVGPAIFEGRFPAPGGLDRLRTMAGVAVVDGSTAHLPVLSLAAAAEPEGLVPLSDLVTFSRLDGGDVRTSVLVYPLGVPVGDTVTLQLVDRFDPARSWRLTDVPVDGG